MRPLSQIALASLLLVGGAARAQSQDPQPQTKVEVQRGKVVCKPTGRCDEIRVHFALDSAKLDDESRAALDREALCMKSNPNLHLTIEGSADARGSRAYNFQLAKRRAEAASCYLQSHGVSSDQLSTVSLGKDHPICQGHTETCFQQNRNARVIARAPVAAR